MGLEPEEARTLGSIQTLLETHVKAYDEDRKDHKEFRNKVYTKLEGVDSDIETVDKKATIAHTRIDKHEVRFGTAKWVVTTIVVVATAVINGIIWIINWLANH